MFHNNIVKISENNEQAELVENLLSSYLPDRFLHNLHSFLLWEKVEMYDVFLFVFFFFFLEKKKTMTRI